MTISGHKALLLIGIFIIALVPSVCFGDFQVSLPAGTSVTMGDATATLSFTVSLDAGETQDIRTLFFNVDTSLYNFSAATQGSTCNGETWVVQLNTPQCSLPECISLTVPTGASGISAGESCTFDLILSGPGDSAFVADSQDVLGSDSLTDVVASKDRGASQQRGDFTLSGDLPTWDRLALAATLVAYPYSTGVGGQIVVTMAVTNRSNSTQSGIVAVDPASPCTDFPDWTGISGGDVDCIGDPIYSSSSITTNPAPTPSKSDIDGAQTTAKVFDTTNYPLTGRILIDTELIDYSGVEYGADRFTGLSRGISATSAAPHVKGAIVYSQDTQAFSIAPGETATIRFIYEATSSGFVYFTASAQNSTGTATSLSTTSNTVVIGDFTTLVEVTPLSIISGQPVTVTMTVENNGLTTFANVTPTLSAGGTATATWVSGPDPSDVGTLSPGESAQFVWQYTVSGSVGQTYNFTGSATADGPVTSNSSTSETGEIVDYAVSVTPTIVSTGSQNVTLTWTVGNNAALEVKQVQIDLSDPIAGVCSSPYDWVYGSDTPPANWGSTVVTDPATGYITGVLFESDPPVGTKGILPGSSKDFSITLSCVEEVTVDLPFNFLVTITDKSNNTASVETTVLVTAYEITLEAYDETCTTTPPPSTLTADGYSKYCFKATLFKAGVPAVGEPIRLTSTAGTLSASDGVTDSNGEVWFYLTAPCSASDVSSTVEARYIPETTAEVTVDFNAVTTPTLLYEPYSLTFFRNSPAPTGDIDSPGLSINTGDEGYFSLDVTNCGPDPGPNLVINGCPDPNSCNTSLAIGSGSPDTFALDSSVDITIPSLETRTLTFRYGTISYGPVQCYPHLTVDAWYSAPDDYAGPYGFDKASPGDTISDSVTVDLGTECTIDLNIRILDWREVY